MLENAHARFELIFHRSVVSAEDVKAHVEMSDGLPVKTLLLRRQEDRRLVAVVLPARLLVDSADSAKQMGVRRLLFGSDRDVLTTGFPLGDVAPFGFLPGSVDRLFVDRRLVSSNAEWIYTGSGDNSKTRKIQRTDLLGLLADTQALDA